MMCGTFMRAAVFVVFLGGSMLASIRAQAAVGAIDATFGVNRTGVPNFFMPIDATEGINGMTPRLGIEYTGTNERGFLGIGFRLTGLAAIAPCRKTIAQDGAAAPVSHFVGDRYCLNGAKLRLVSGTYGGSGAVYSTELDQLARITSYDSINGIPGWFKVEARNGLIYEYGNATTAILRTTSSQSGRIQFWELSKISDRSGNSIFYTYDKDDDEHRFRPSLICYTNCVAGRYTIAFVYQSIDRADNSTENVNSSSTLGDTAQIRQPRLLERIELKHEGAIYRQYRLTYETGAGENSRLVSIQQCAATTNECFPVTTIDWFDATAGHGPLASTGVATPDAIAMDLNGDGFDDLVWASGGTWRFMLGNSGGYGTAVNTGITATNPLRALPIEWSGDGREDLLVDWADGYWRVLKGMAMGFEAPVPAGPNGVPSSGGRFWAADIDGDGRDELLRAQSVPTEMLRIWARPNSGSGFGNEALAFEDPSLRPRLPFFGSPSERQRSAQRRVDFDGDDREDFIVRVCEFSGVHGDPCTWEGWVKFYGNGLTVAPLVVGGDITGTAKPMYANLNGDNLTDLVYQCQAVGRWCAAVSTSRGSFGTISLGPATTGYLSYLYLRKL